MAVRKEVLLNKLGERLRRIRQKNKLTQAKLANAINKDRQSLQRLEQGRINPSIYYLYEIAEGLDIPMKKLLDFDLH